jgi:hypothetical protein
MTRHCYLLFILKHKEEGNDNCYCCFHYYNTSIEEDDDTLQGFRVSQKKMKKREGAYLQALALLF